jgi:hypothetical protein
VLAGGSEEFGAIGGAAIGQEALDLDAMSGEEADGLLESVDGAGDFFVRKEAGKSEAGVIVDGDVQAFHAGTWIAASAIAGGTDAGLREAAQLLDVEVKEFAGLGAFVTLDWRFGRFEGREAVEVMAAQDTREGGFGDGQHRHDLSVGAAFAAQGQNAGFELRAGLARLMMRDRGSVRQAGGKAGFLGAFEPAADRLVANAESDGGGAQGEAELRMLEGHLGSGERSKSGISVHVVRVEKRWVES